MQKRKLRINIRDVNQLINEVRKRIAKLVREGNTREAIAGQMGVGMATVYRVLAANGISKNIKTL